MKMKGQQKGAVPARRRIWPISFRWEARRTSSDAEGESGGEEFRNENAPGSRKQVRRSIPLPLSDPLDYKRVKTYGLLSTP
jgi:hypothetical protein